jgi:hypothetical protein
MYRHSYMGLTVVQVQCYSCSCMLRRRSTPLMKKRPDLYLPWPWSGSAPVTVRDGAVRDLPMGAGPCGSAHLSVCDLHDQTRCHQEALSPLLPAKAHSAAPKADHSDV